MSLGSTTDINQAQGRIYDQSPENFLSDMVTWLWTDMVRVDKCHFIDAQLYYHPGQSKRLTAEKPPKKQLTAENGTAY